MKWIALLLLALPGFAADTASHFASFDGVKVHYESYGAGKDAVVFIHGWTCDLTFWRGQAPVYNNRRSLLIDLPGHGQSDKPKVAYPVEFFARGIEAVLHDAGVERAVLVGHSLGGPIAYSFIRLFPAQAKALVLVDATVYNLPSDASFQAAQQVQYQQKAQRLSGAVGEKNFLAAVNAMFSAKTPPLLRRPDPREDAGNAGARARRGGDQPFGNRFTRRRRNLQRAGSGHPSGSEGHRGTR